MTEDLVAAPVAGPLSAIAEQHIALAEDAAEFDANMELVDTQLAQLMPALMELLSDAAKHRLPAPEVGTTSAWSESDSVTLHVREIRWARRRMRGLRLSPGCERVIVVHPEGGGPLDLILSLPTTLDEHAIMGDDEHWTSFKQKGTYHHYYLAPPAVRAAVAAALPQIIADLTEARATRRALGVNAVAAVQQAMQQLTG